MDIHLLRKYRTFLLLIRTMKFKILKYSTKNRDGYREYKSNPCECSKCPYLDRCTNSKNRQKVITPHIWQEFVDEASHL